MEKLVCLIIENGKVENFKAYNRMVGNPAIFGFGLTAIFSSLSQNSKIRISIENLK
jgi:hypothetical protein